MCFAASTSPVRGKVFPVFLLWWGCFDMQPDVNSIKLALSKILGFGVVVGASVVRLPQIGAIYKAKSATGLSLAMFVLELIR
jgi:hypothetical protein